MRIHPWFEDWGTESGLDGLNHQYMGFEGITGG